MECKIWYVCRKFWTRNRPGDRMRDRYNLNTLPGGSEHELAEFGKRTSDMLHIYYILSNLYKVSFASSLYSYGIVKWNQGRSFFKLEIAVLRESSLSNLTFPHSQFPAFSFFLDPDATAGPLIPGMGQIPSGPILASKEEGELTHTWTCTHVIVILHIWKLT